MKSRNLVTNFFFSLPHGHGVLTFSSPDQFSRSTYTGSFSCGLRHASRAKQAWTDGAEYAGEFKEGERTGWGKMVYPNG